MDVAAQQRATKKKKTENAVFYHPGWLWRRGTRSRDYLPARATLNAQSTRHGARPGPELAPSVHAAPVRAPQPRGKASGRTRNGLQCAKKWHLVLVRIDYILDYILTPFLPTNERSPCDCVCRTQQEFQSGYLTSYRWKKATHTVSKVIYMLHIYKHLSVSPFSKLRHPRDFKSPQS